jgi:hypothetical protein
MTGEPVPETPEAADAPQADAPVVRESTAIDGRLSPELLRHFSEELGGTRPD